MERWKEITIGITDLNGILKYYRDQNPRIDVVDPGNVLSKVNLEPLTHSVRLLVSSVADLGFETRPSYQAVCQKILSLEHGLCELDDVMTSRMVYNEQPETELLHAAMEPIKGTDGKKYVFSLDTTPGRRYLFGRALDGFATMELYRQIIFREKPARFSDLGLRLR